MNDKYPPLPEPFYDRGNFGAVMVDCYNDEQMRAYADAATNTLRAQLAEAQRDAEQLRKAAGRVPPKRQDDAPLDFDGDFEEDLWDERDE